MTSKIMSIDASKLFLFSIYWTSCFQKNGC
jgi:hypothetical protein